MTRYVAVSRCAAVTILLTIVHSAGALAEETKATDSTNTPEVFAGDKILKAISKPATFRFVEEPLVDVMSHIAHQHKLPVFIDRAALEEAGIPAEIPVTIDISDVSLRAALRLMLRESQLTYLIRNETLLITTPERSETELTTHVFPVLDLVRIPGADPSNERDVYNYGPLYDLTQSTIQPTTWDDVGGPGSLRGYRGTMVISQTDPTHEEIAHLFAGLRRLPLFDAQESAEQEEPVPTIVSASPWIRDDDKFAKVLQKKTELEFVEEPLEEVLQHISKKHHIPTFIDSAALEELGIPRDIPVTISLKGITLRSALHWMLRDLQLTFMLRDEVLIITTSEKSETELTTVIYNVRDLVLVTSSGADYGPLIELIQSIVDPTTWDDVGGPGSVREFSQRGALVCSQTDEVHSEIASLLARIRREKLSNFPAEDDDPGKVVTGFHLYESEILRDHEEIVRDDGKGRQEMKVARRPEIAPAQLQSLIIKHVEPGSWDSDQFSIQVIPGRVIVKHRREVQSKVRTFLMQLGLKLHGGGFGGGHF